MDTKYIFVTGGVVSGLGKGITAASLGRLLKSRGYTITMQKFDPYLNVDAGTMNPFQHGEVYVTEDGAETDLDLGHYERFIDEPLTQSGNITSGAIYWSVIGREREGKYNGETIQLVPHITDAIKNSIAKENTDFVIIEIGGTVGDIEGLPFLEAIRQFSTEVGRTNCAFIHVTLLPYIRASHEQKTKPTQHSVKELLGLGIQPDFIALRTEHNIEPSVKEKISHFCNVPIEHVILNKDVSCIYEVPLALAEENLDLLVLKHLNLPERTADMKQWEEMVHELKTTKTYVTIGLVGKYVELPDAYLSVAESLYHGGIANHTAVRITWIDAETLTRENATAHLEKVDGIMMPGGFGARGIEGMIAAAEYARTYHKPYFGICLGMQVAAIEFARNQMELANAHSTEFAPDTPHPVIDLMPEQLHVKRRGGTMRLGQYPCKLSEDSISYHCYQKEEISERHRHRYEFNSDYIQRYESHGMRIAGTSPDQLIVEIIEVKTHPWYIGVQFHPEFQSKPNRPHPLFAGFIHAAKTYKEIRK